MVLVPPALDAGSKAIAARFEEIGANLKSINTALSRLIPLVEQSRLEASNLDLAVDVSPKIYPDSKAYRAGAFEPVLVLALTPPPWASRCILTVGGEVAFSMDQIAASPQAEMRLECAGKTSVAVSTLFAPTDGRMSAALATSWSISKPTYTNALWAPFTAQLTAKGSIGVTAGPCRLTAMPIWLSMGKEN